MTEFSILFGFIIFVVVILFTFYLPGRFLLRRIDYSSESFAVIVALSLSLGISMFLLVVYSLSWLHLEFLYLGCILFFSIAEISKSFKEIKYISNKKRYFGPEFIILAIGSFMMVYITGRSGLEEAGALSFYGIHYIDSIFHISIIGNLTNHFPPTHPGLADVPLRGYHFFYDFILSYFVKYFQFNVYDLFFRFFPLFTGFFYGIAGIALSRFLKLSTFTSLIFLYLLYFVQGSELLLINFFPSVFINYNSGIIQSLSNIVNPSVVFSIPLLFSAYILLFSKSKKLTIIMAAIIFGVLPQIKIYTAIMAFSGLGTVALYTLIKGRNTYFMKILICASIIAGFIYLPLSYGAGGLLFAPLLLYRHFMEMPQNLPSYQWGLKYQYYEAYNNFLGLGKLYALALLFFFFPTLGIRLISLKLLPNMLKKTTYTLQNIFLFAAVLFAFLLASFFIQTSGEFNIIQFFWIAYIILLIPTAFAISSMGGKIMTNKIVVVIILFIITFFGIHRVLESYSGDPYTIDRNLIVISDKIKKIVDQKDGILVLTKNFYLSPIISSLTFHPIFYETEVAAFNLVSTTINERKNTIAYLDNLLSNCNGDFVEKELVESIKKTKNKYVLTLDEYSCFRGLNAFELLANEGVYALYRIRER